MTREFNYISDRDLEQLIYQVEQNELATAPPDLMEEILEKLEAEQNAEAESVQQMLPKGAAVKSVATKKKEFYAYCFRVITSVAAAIALVFLLPEMSGMAGQEVSVQEFSKQEIPGWEEIADIVPSREEIVLAEQTPTRDEVLDDTGFIEKVLNNTGWFNKQNGED